ncbi:ribosomal RNA-processing protein 7-domain-containing protein [Lineolata rhizophorae]|uniref:Ribosomal RNA-processing protein 7-domain-containing protein n=1 Tax=Lineolata rhizophorae TaxID=578093 RepID=A0A6A6P2B4_9PEZI|nr:ribosomal RNA-processing protein 7-domain-containing protein [Lineolata rhizophorae]
MSLPSITLGDFVVLPLTFPPLPSFPRAVKHNLYLRPYVPHTEDPNSSEQKTLFVTNLPIDATEVSLRKLFKDQLGGYLLNSVRFDDDIRSGNSIADTNSSTARAQATKGKKRKHPGMVDAASVERAEIMTLPRTWDTIPLKSGSSAVLVFVDIASAEGALRAAKKAAKSQTEIMWSQAMDPDESSTGELRYRRHQLASFPPAHVLQRSVNAFLTHFNSLEALRERLRTQQRNVPDEEGFVTVTRGGRMGPARQEEAEQALQKVREKEEARRKEMGDFYRFQWREKRKEKELNLRKKFQEDVRKVEGMRKRKRAIKPERI